MHIQPITDTKKGLTIILTSLQQSSQTPLPWSVSCNCGNRMLAEDCGSAIISKLNLST